jgi:NADH:ubiquinone oxidoreductase subunit 6 (subunit J)
MFILFKSNIEKTGVLLSKFLIGLSFLMIVGFVAVNTYFIGSMMASVDIAKKKSKYQTLKYLAMGSWIAIVVWFMVTVLIFYIKHSGRTFKT